MGSPIIIAVVVLALLGTITGSFFAGVSVGADSERLKQVKATASKNKALQVVLDVAAGRRAKSEALQLEIGDDLKSMIAQIPDSEPVSCPDVAPPQQRLVFVDPPREGVVPGPMPMPEPRVETRVETRMKIVKVGCDYPAEIRAKLNSLQVRQ